MNKIFILILIFTTITLNVFSQKVQIGFGFGIGTFAMTDLKGLNSQISSTLPFESKIVSNFPPFWYYQFTILFKDNHFGFGLCYNYKSTGSRIASEDYSGIYRFDMKIQSNSPSFIGEYEVQIIDNLFLGIYTTTGFEFTNLYVNEYLMTNNNTYINMSLKFNAHNLFIQPGIEMNYLYKSVGLKLNAGYLIQSRDDSFSSNKDPNSSPYINIDPLKPDWNGYRIGLTLFYNI